MKNDNWKTVRLGDVCEQIFAGGDASKICIVKERSEDYPYPVFANAVENNGLYGYTNIAKVSKPALTISGRGTIGFTAVRLEPYYPIIRLISVIPKHNLYDIKYFYYAVIHNDFHSTGTSIPQLTVPQVENYKIPLPPLEEQKHIAAVLDKCTEVIAKHKLMLEKYDTLVKSQFVEMFGDISTGEYKFETRKLGQVAEVGSSHRVFTTEFVEHGIPFYRGTEIGELANGKIPQEPYYISEEHYQRLIAQDSKPQIGDLLMPSICNKGQVWMVDTAEPFYYKDGRVLSISPNQEIYNSKYLQYFMREKTLIEYPKLGSGSTFAEFKIFLLKDIDVLTPPLALQEKFAAFVQAVDAQKAKAQKSLEKAEILYKALMQEYFG